MDKEIKSSHELLEQKKMQCKCLEDQMVKLRSKCCESINSGAIKDREIERLANLVRVARRKLFSKSSSTQQADTPLEESSKLSLDNSMSDEALLKILSSEETEDSLIPTKQATRSESSNCELFEHCLRYLGSAMLHHESLIDKANARVRDLISTSHSINLQLHVMQEVLSMQHLKEDGDLDEKDISVGKEVSGPSGGAGATANRGLRFCDLAVRDHVQEPLQDAVSHAIRISARERARRLQGTQQAAVRQGA
ncbi:hypothetical protein MTO96_033901 [Rhipicephalus appendiculatus]